MVVASYFFFNVLPPLLCSVREVFSVCCRLCRMLKMKQGLMKICVLWLAQSGEVRTGGCCSAVASPKHHGLWVVHGCSVFSPCPLKPVTLRLSGIFHSVVGSSLTEGCGKGVIMAGELF